jgi:hypothetical protein
VIDVEPLIARELDRLVPEPAGVRADWSDVVGRAGLQPARRRLAFAFVALAAVLVVAGAVAKTLGGFDTWLSGTPGTSASEEAQQRFESANGRSWSFPSGTKLRELIRTKVEGTEYVLYGFRSGNSLCLQLEASGEAREAKGCAPASVVVRISAPVVVVVGDFAFNDRRERPTARASFGIVTDSVTRVEVDATDAVHRAHVGGNAYLFVQSEPNSPSPVQSVTAVDSTGRSTTVQIVNLLDPVARPSTPPGPTTVEARIVNPRIGWYERGERRGVSIDDLQLTTQERDMLRGARLFKPDPLSDVIVGLRGRYCLVTRSTASCSRERFSGGALSTATMGASLSSEFLTVYGMAADGVSRVTIFLADGQQLDVSIRDNVFAAIVPTRLYPIRVVGYDAHDRVVAIDTLPNWGLLPAAPAKARRLYRTRTVTGPNGSTATVDFGSPTEERQCWRLRTAAVTRTGCRPAPPSIKIVAQLVQPGGRDVFVLGWASEDVVRVDLELPLRHRIASVRPPRRGYYLIAIPREHLGRERRHAYLVGFDRAGRRVQRVSVFYRSR